MAKKALAACTHKTRIKLGSILHIDKLKVGNSCSDHAWPSHRRNMMSEDLSLRARTSASQLKAMRLHARLRPSCFRTLPRGDAWLSERWELHCFENASHATLTSHVDVSQCECSRFWQQRPARVTGARAMQAEMNYCLEGIAPSLYRNGKVCSLLAVSFFGRMRAKGWETRV